MRFQVKSGKKLAGEIARIAAKLVRHIRKRVKLLNREPGSETIHEIRMAIKKLRALLRLIRDGFGRKFYRRQHHSLRALAHCLSPSRDAAVQLATLRKLRRHCHQLSADDISDLENRLIEKKRNTSKSKQLSKSQFRDTLRQINRWPFKNLKRRDIKFGIERGYQKLVKARHLAVQSPGDENLHTWRKRAKNLYYELLLIKKIGPKSADKLARQIKELGKYLGNDHDLVLLTKELHHGSSRLHRHVHARRAEFQKLAFHHGDLIQMNAAILLGPWR
ncbi:MAG TPA: CHAD domain-containing protein [Verrucomicrobiae bacterium]|jgi:CHAD domain-containing protein|nr:CHAD domain-containing protein [Verrucomicrobiae bacterium]